MKKDVIIAGVGGQGSLFATQVLCRYAVDRGLQVQGSETIGAAQRGGSVVSHMRISDGAIYSPLIPPGVGDVLIGMESVELLRNLKMLSRAGYYIWNRFAVPTVYSNLGIDRYPSESEIEAAIDSVCDRGASVAATKKAAELGSPQMTNVVLLGVLARMDDFFEEDPVREIVATVSPERFTKANLRAFDEGRNLV